jgi:hypothetical protein
MKTLNYILLGIIIFYSQSISSQISIDTVFVSAKKNTTIKVEAVRYYYYPNLQAYFDIKYGLFIFKEKGSWVTSQTMDAGFKGYSVKNAFHVSLNEYHGEEPFKMLSQHKLKYPADYSSKRRPKQLTEIE